MKRKDYISRNCKKEIHSFCGFPSVRFYDNGGKIRTLAWHNNGDLHRLDGPAYIYYNLNGYIKKSYLIYGKSLSKEEFDLESNRIKTLKNL